MRNARSFLNRRHALLGLPLAGAMLFSASEGSLRATPASVSASAADRAAAPASPTRSSASSASAESGTPTTAETSTQTLAEKLELLRDLNSKGRYAECETGARALLAEVEAGAGGDSREAAEVLDVLVASLWKGGKAVEAETLNLARRSLQLAEAQFGAESLETARAANTLGNVHLNRGELPAIAPHWERVLAIREKLLGPDHPDVGAALNNLAILAEQTGAYQQSRALAERSVAIREKALGPEHPDVATSLGNLGTALGRLGDFEGEKRAHERSLAILEKALGPDHPRVANALEALCKAEMDVYDQAAARLHCERMVAVREKMLGPDHPHFAFGLDNLAYVLLEMGEPAPAIGMLERALAIQEQALGPDHTDVAYTLEHLALARARTGLPEEARTLYLRALAIEEKTYGPDHPRYAEILAALARVHVELGEDKEARPLFERALKITETALAPEDHSIVPILIDLGDLEAHSGKSGAAEQLYRRALALRERYYGPSHYAVAEVLLRLVPFDQARGDVTSVMKTSLRAAGLLREHFRRMAQGLSEREALRFRENLDSGLNDALATLAADPGSSPSWASPVLDELIRSRAMVLDEMGVRHRAATEGLTPGSAALSDTLRSTRTRLARLIVKGPVPPHSDQYRRKLEEAEAAEERAERDLAAASAAFRTEQAQSRAGLDEVRKALPPSSVLIACVKYPRPARPPTSGGAPAASPAFAYLAFVLHPESGKIAVVPLGDAAKIDSLVEAWKRELQSPPEGLAVAGGGAEARYREVGRRLREVVWDPLAPHVSDSRQAFIVPDGALNLASLAVLPTESDRYLVETGPVLHYLSAERDLLHHPTPAGGGRGLLAMGGPDFDADPRVPRSASPASAPPRPGAATMPGSERAAAIDPKQPPRSPVYRGPAPSCADFRRLRFDPLPGAATEVADIDRLWGKSARKGSGGRESSLVLAGAAASESSFKQKAPDFRVVHIATHGFFLPDRCELEPPPGKSVAASGSGSPSADPPAAANPLLLSGLAFAGANRRDEVGADSGMEDGILTSEEIASLDLSGVDWVVLSGCDTGAGVVVSGEGVLGLRRAFDVAGARTLIMSLWRVEDAAAAEWMRRLYQARGAGLSTAETMRKASLAVLRDRRSQGKSTHPFTWGAFVAAGDWR